MSLIIYIDIETIPGSNPAILGHIKANLKPPGNMSKQETIDKWWTEKSESVAIDKMKAGGLHAEYGEIACIGMAVNDEPVEVIAGETEQDTLAMFVHALDLASSSADHRQPVFVGHNSNGFDLPFIYQRAACRSVGLPIYFPTPPEIKAWSERCQDTMVMWAGARGTISMDRLAFALGIDGKGDFDGSMVASAWANGERQKIMDYCKSDVGLTRAIYKRLAMVAY